jgi:hypothetical protein
VTALRASIVLAFAAAFAACGTQGTAISSNSWTCSALAGETFFKGYGMTREQAFESAMNQCKLNAPDANMCTGDPDRCMPPAGKG